MHARQRSLAEPAVEKYRQGLTSVIAASAAAGESPTISHSRNRNNLKDKVFGKITFIEYIFTFCFETGGAARNKHYRVELGGPSAQCDAPAATKPHLKDHE